MYCFLICTCLSVLNGCVSYAPKSIAPHINLSPENVQLAADSDKCLDFGMEVESNESDTLDNLEVLPGIRIRSLHPSGVAQKAGLKRGDVILTVNDIKTNHTDTLATISETSVAEQFVFMVRRDTTVFEITLSTPETIKISEPKERYRADPLKTRAGYRTEIVQLDSNGIEKKVVARIVQQWPDSPLIKAGIGVGDAVVSVDHVSIESAQDLINHISNNCEYGQKVVFSIMKKNAAGTPEPSDIEVTLWDPGRSVTQFNVWPLFIYKAKRNPDQKKFSILDVWLFSLFSYERDESERKYSLLKFIRFESDNRGELVDKTNASGQENT
jgi:membrane-associated protease RseP (regulator of RpoE activity)